MTYCKRCFYNSYHPLKITFDNEGICSGCRIHEEKDVIDWKERLQRLKEIVAPYKNSSRTINDCIIPVSGARDSYFVVDFVKNTLGMNPMLVTYNKHYNTLLGIRNLSYLKTTFSAPLLTLTTNPEIVKKITRYTLDKFCSIYWHCIAGQTVFPVQIAYRFKIPLIIWGFHQGLDQVGMFSHLDEVEMTRKYRKEHDLMGFEAEDLIGHGDLEHKDLENYLYPQNKEIEAVGIRGIYLNNYVRWDIKSQHEKMISLYQYETEKQQRTFDSYSDVDCYHYSGLHDYIKYVKCGYSKITDHVNRELRLKRLTREEGLSLIKKYENINPIDTKVFCEWIGIEEKTMYKKIEKFRNAKTWFLKKNKWINVSKKLDLDDGKGNLKHSLEKIEDCTFINNSKRTNQKEINKYTLIGRGWVD